MQHFSDIRQDLPVVISELFFVDPDHIDDRERLYGRIEARIDRMLEEGLVEARHNRKPAAGVNILQRFFRQLLKRYHIEFFRRFQDIDQMMGNPSQAWQTGGGAADR